jgi:hypothetical protein
VIQQPVLYQHTAIARLVGFEDGPVIQWGARGRPLPLLHMDAPQLLALNKTGLLKLLGEAPAAVAAKKKRKAPQEQVADMPRPSMKKPRIIV